MRKINLKTIHPMIRTFYLVLSLVILSVSSVEAQRKKKNKVEESSPVSSFDSKYYNSLKWRNIGPFRGGRSNAASGVIGDPLTYYFGSVGGGVWKTTDAGTSWSNITDGFLKTGTVGAIEVAASDQNVIYVGMGEHAVRGVMTSSGDGIYRSTDAGRTWTHKGLDDTKHISGIAIHPDNPDWLYVAAQGAFWNDSDSRGIYMSKDGGDSWEKMHEVNASTGAADIVMDENNPRILYAAYWDHRRLPWQVRSGGPGSGIYKSVDGGQNWKKIVKGLPEVMGKVSVTVSPANSDRLYANNLRYSLVNEAFGATKDIKIRLLENTYVKKSQHRISYNELSREKKLTSQRFSFSPNDRPDTEKFIFQRTLREKPYKYGTF